MSRIFNNISNLSVFRGTDDLLPVLTYVVVKTRLPQLVSECVAMEEFIHEGLPAVLC